MALLYLTPLISSTCSLYFAWDQYLFLRIFLKKDIVIYANRLQASYWKTFFPEGAVAVVGLIGVTSGASFTLLRTSASLLRDKGSFYWYLAGGALALSHLLWAPPTLPLISTLQDEKKDPENAPSALRSWLTLHVARAIISDAPCFVSCLVAAVKTLSP
ncbi:uncharacterized protein F4822DRAFT_445098 [Hypoxylon trugodes]|uniref:uncharacterized protein n=1 Tax=Hypoxylon trugodes TaxID=326681 RepID=UPI0021A0DD65|nr:uncharacterized protein F4822DRAFT_445098 [Hypoxylon trugodes]KAI1386968.1 hypothetical protein F4822DRAFT_445098 [Hypoxylon trugodes]